jgi:hypothetical protein
VASSKVGTCTQQEEGRHMVQVCCVSLSEVMLERKQNHNSFEFALNAYARMVALVSHQPIKRDFGCADLDALISSGVTSILLLDQDAERVVGMIEGRRLPNTEERRDKEQRTELTCLSLRVRNFYLTRQWGWSQPAYRQKAFCELIRTLIRQSVMEWQQEYYGLPQPREVELRFYGRRPIRARRLSTSLVTIPQRQR